MEYSVFAIGSMTGPEVLRPILLVFGAVPKPVRNVAVPTKLGRSYLNDKVITYIRREQAKRKSVLGLKYSKGRKPR